MASDPRSVFSRYALAALGRARAQFEADRWALGIEAASAQSLRASLDQAIAATAKRASVSHKTVHKLVPGEQVESILAELAARHTEALQTARRYASSFTGLLSRSLHIEDSSAPAYLRGLAARHHDDEFICAPLTAFAEQLARWQQLMELVAKEIGFQPSAHNLVPTA